MVTPARLGSGNSYDFGARELDSRLGRWWSIPMRLPIYKSVCLGRFLSVDPITHKYPMLTPYQFASNTPIMASDLDGKEADATAIYGMLWSSAGITTTTGDEVVHKFNEGMAKAARVSTDVLLVTVHLPRTNFYKALKFLRIYEKRSVFGGVFSVTSKINKLYRH